MNHGKKESHFKITGLGHHEEASMLSNGALMIKDISEKLGIQIIMVSHIHDQNGRIIRCEIPHIF